MQVEFDEVDGGECGRELDRAEVVATSGGAVTCRLVLIGDGAVEVVDR